MAVNTVNQLIDLLNQVDTDATVLASIANDSAVSLASGPAAGLVTTRLGSNVKNVQKVIADIENGITTGVRPSIQLNGTDIALSAPAINFLSSTGVTVTEEDNIAIVDLREKVSRLGEPVDNQIGVWGSSTELQGDTKLTFDGSTLTVQADAGPKIEINDTNDSATFFQQIINPGTPVALVGTATEHSLRIVTNGVSRLAIGPNGNLAVNSTDTSLSTLLVNDTEPDIMINDIPTATRSTIGYASGTLSVNVDVQDTDSNSAISFTVDGNEHLNIDSRGDITISGAINDVHNVASQSEFDDLESGQVIEGQNVRRTDNGFVYNTPNQAGTSDVVTSTGGLKLNILRIHGDMFRPEQWGDRTGTNINKAQEAALDAGGFPVLLSGGETYNLDETLIIHPGCGLKGYSQKGTILRVANGLNDDAIRTVDYDDLYGTDSWLVSEGVPTRFYLTGFRLDGNKANNTSGHGIRLYGKRFKAEDLMIYDTEGRGFWSACANKGGQESWDDMPESIIRDIFIRDSGTENFRYEGPHDGFVESLLSGPCGEDGVVFTSDFSTVNGAADIGFIHSYAAEERGFYSNVPINADYIQGESCKLEGVVLDAEDCTVGRIKAFKNHREDQATEAARDDASVLIAGAAKVGAVYSRTDHGGTALLITGTSTSIGQAELVGESKNGVGLSVDANRVTVSACTVDGFDGGTGTGVEMGASGAHNGNDIRFSSRECDTHYNVANAGSGTVVSGDIFTAAGEVSMAGTRPGTLEEVSIISRGSSTAGSRSKGTATIPDTTNFVTVTHNLAGTPRDEDIILTPNSNLNGLSIWVSGLTATTFQINASGPVSGAKLIGWRAQL